MDIETDPRFRLVLSYLSHLVKPFWERLFGIPSQILLEKEGQNDAQRERQEAKNYKRLLNELGLDDVVI